MTARIKPTSDTRAILVGACATLALANVAVVWWVCSGSFSWKQKDKGNNWDEFEEGQLEKGSQRHSANHREKQKDADADKLCGHHVIYHHQRLPIHRIRDRASRLLRLCQQRRTLRFFSRDPVPKDVVEKIIAVACSAPSGAHKQPWFFVAVQNQQTKQKIRDLVEKEETINYERRMRKTWVDDVSDMVSQLHDTSSQVSKPYLTEAPWLIVVFKQPHGIDPNTNERVDHYYVEQSVGIACGMLTVAIQNANLVTLTSTPMGAEKGIRELLGRSSHEKVFLLMPVGYPAPDATVPYRNPERKPMKDALSWY